MKKFKYILLLCTLPILLTGCVKFNTNMVIKKDKSMDFSIIYALDSSLLEDQEVLEDEDKTSLENQGFTVSEYSEDNMKGFKIVKSIKNIDSVSSTNDIEYNLSGVLDDKSENNYIFKVKKGFFKNIYTAKFKFDASESDLNDTTLDSSEDYDWTLDSEDSDTEDYDFSSDIDFSSMMANMDLSFNITLPYSAKSNNASTTNNDNKSLSWNLSSTQTEAIEFEFELYNMTNIYITIGVVALIVIIIVISIINKKKNNGNTTVLNDQNVNNKTQNLQQSQEYSYTEREFQKMIQPQVNQNQQSIDNLNQDIGISQQSIINNDSVQQDSNNNLFN